MNLADNQICGLNEYGDGTYTTEGITVIAEALKVTPSVTSVNVLSNQLDMESADFMLKVKAEKPNLRTLCGLTHEETELDYRGCGLGPGDAKLLAPEILVMPSVTVINVMGNNFDPESAKMLIEVAKQKSLSLCGIQRDQTIANFHFQGLKPVDAILLASDLSQADVTGSLTSLSLGDNPLGDQGIEALSVGLKESKSLAILDLHNSYGNSEFKFGPKGAAALASAIAIMGSVTSVWTPAHQP